MCGWKTKGTVTLQNNIISEARTTEEGDSTVYGQRLLSNPIVMTNGDTTIKVRHQDHGMYDADNNVSITGVSSGISTTLNGALLDVKKYEEELFGEEKKDGSILYGALEKATGGFLLIDEVSEIPLETQSKILRVLIDQKFKRINGNHDIRVDVRIICSSAKNIKTEINNGNFREDLFHRLNVFQIDVEPLKNRTQDIPELVKYFSKKISENYNLKKFDINPDNHYMIDYTWPGNVRELRNLIERIAILAPESNEKVSNIIKESLKSQNYENLNSENALEVPLKEARENFEKEYLTTQLKKFGGNISKMAKFIGMERSALHRKLKGLNIKDLN